ncbi:single-stranded-DNA-specific exonuclease RecJ [Desulfallas thermosapovorans]|uniref:Single-stranded-DNA-specific exonuclease RecJ n=1 Tax=Desulfallas thermosapovorans DSM 6562 TaxID=1121431 RepID=A0A5S4ZR56_9FIRM|nr:single-stranded-DNA-specific exonuclease RecJ [Desulfallas thermosapovorans]TYO95103.1 single-stranded-DNA-specific exonuclease [Desulfallas thermosapovorans DSM 6562]
MQKSKKWVIKAAEPVLQLILSKGLGVSSLMAQLLINRGIYTVKAARAFLNASIKELHPPELMGDLPRAVQLICRALARGDKILVYGDYDVDGVTGTALLVHVLRRLGGNVEYYIPHRLDDGYGLHTPVLQRARESGIGLVLTVDCGISAVAEIDEANLGGGPVVIITDHHEPPPELPRAAAVVNPKRKDCHYPFSDLAGVGVAFKLVQALLAAREHPFGWEEYLDLVCLGTIADIVPLQGENRILVKHGLSYLANSPRPGLRALCQVSGVKEDALSTWEVGFILAPRINAAGRLDDAGLAVELLLCDDHEKAREMALLLNQANQERQRLEADTLSEALGMLENDPQLADQDVLVLASANWHPGVIGIVASRLVDRFYKPVLLVACDNGLGRGSARSTGGFNLYSALEYCSGCLAGYGGHALAAGFSLPVEQIDELREKINDYAVVHPGITDTEPVMELDALVSLQDITFQLINEIEKLAPYGHGNPGPLFALKQARLVNCRGVGKNNAHLKMLLSDRNVSMDGIGFNLGRFAGELATGKEISVAFTPTVNTWQGRRNLQVKVHDVHPEPLAEEKGQWREDNLRFAGDLVLVPETITCLLQEFLSQRGYSLPPEMNTLRAGVMESGTNFPADFAAPAPGGPVLPPAQNRVPAGALREKRLARLNPSPGCTLLVANCACHALQVYRYIENHNSQFSGLITCLHGFMSRDYINDQLNKINRQMIKLAVVTPVCLGEKGALKGPFDRVLLVRPPATVLDWQQLKELAGTRSAPGLELLYGAEDWDENRRHLEELAPERDVLAHYYALLRSLASGSPGAVSKTAVLEKMARAGYSMYSCISLVVAAAIFADLGLLQFDWQEDMLKYKLLPFKGKKLDLSASPTFNWAHNIKSNGLNWIDLNVKASGA